MWKKIFVSVSKIKAMICGYIEYRKMFNIQNLLPANQPACLLFLLNPIIFLEFNQAIILESIFSNRLKRARQILSQIYKCALIVTFLVVIGCKGWDVYLPSLSTPCKGTAVASYVARAAETGSVVINEIMWMGSIGVGETTSSKDEWIELYNLTSQDIDISGWAIEGAASAKGTLVIPDDGIEHIIPADGFYLIAYYSIADRILDPKTTILDTIVDLRINKISLANNYSDNGQLVLKDRDGVIIDQTPLPDGAKWSAGEYKSKEIYRSMERNDFPGDGTQNDNWHTCSEAVNLIEGAIECGTPREKNSEVAEPQGSPSGDSDGMDDVAAGVEEVEGEDEAGESASASSDADALDGKEAAVNEEGEERNLEVETPAMKAGQELRNSEISDADEKKSAKTTPNSSFVRRGSIMAGKIIINEIFPNPNGSDFEEEFIELKNIGGQEVNAAGWIIKNKTNQYKISTRDLICAIIPAGGFFLLPRKMTKIALNNSADKIELFSAAGKRQDSVSYGDYAIENISYIKIDDEWEWSAAITAGKENFYIAPNREPQAIIDSGGVTEILAGERIIFDASDSFDPDDDSLSFFWKTSDGIESGDAVFRKEFNSPGEYEISLKATDPYDNSSAAKIKIKVLDDFWKGNGNYSAFSAESEPINYKLEWEDISIAEILPNPEGSDNGEWIKIYNDESFPVNLGGWMLDDREGGSAEYVIPMDVIIGARGFFVFEKSKTGIALNNDSDEARLFSPDGILRSEIKYGKVKEGEIVENLEISARGGSASDGRNWKLGNLEIVEAGEKGKTKDLGGEEIKKLKISLPAPDCAGGQAGNWEFEGLEGEEIIIEGYVSAKPGVLGKQVFYLTDGVHGAEVYLWDKDFPELETGDFIAVDGELLYNEGWRIKISEKADIQVVSYEHPPLAVEKAIKDITEESIHSLTMINGQVVEKNGSNIYLDDGRDEIKIYIMDSTGISTKDITVGEDISVIGILDSLKGSFRLLPRNQEDLRAHEGRILGVKTAEDGKDAEIGLDSHAPQSLMDTAAGHNAYDKPSIAKNKLIVYLSLSLAFLTIIGTVVWKRG